MATESKKAMLCGGNYQECLTAPLSNTADEDGDGDVDMNNDDHILTCVNKVNPWLFFCAYWFNVFYVASKNHSLNSLKS